MLRRGPGGKVGLLVGRERTFPDALIAEVHRRDVGVTCEYAAFSAPDISDPPPYDVLVDRISHEVTCYQPFLKQAALAGTRVVNNPFWRIVDDKFFNAALARRIGIAVPKTVLLPSKSYGPDITGASLERNMRFVDWDVIEQKLGYPMFMKPHWGGGWRDVSKIENRAELMAAYDKSGEKTMILQQGIVWKQYVRVIVVGQRDVRPALWDPRLGHFDRYKGAAESMPKLSITLQEQVAEQALTITQALGYDMNTVEFAVGANDGVPYAIDYMNSAPDFDVSSLGDEHFDWVVRHMAALVIDRVKETPAARYRWDDLLRGR
jgi:glutathione synthase/RimK-type ligase-like ATP-grasp enzyme